MRTIFFFLVVLLFHPLFADGWNWDGMDAELLEFPTEFLFGSDIEETEYKKNSSRFSIDWSVVEPEEGIFDENAISQYLERLKELEKLKITPMVTLHSFQHPPWFEAKGGFEKEENIEYFVRFCKHVFAHLGDRVHLWCTMHEPTVYVLMGHLLGLAPPAKRDFYAGATVLRNLLRAHCDVYRELKGMAYGESASIGIVHNYLTFEPHHQWNPMESIPSALFTDNLHGAVMKFLKEGIFEFYIPVVSFMSYQNLDAPKSFDFIGLSYTPCVVLSGDFPPAKKLDTLSDPFYGEEFYIAISECAHLGKPIYITEGEKSGIKYLYVVSEAIEGGIDIRGYFKK